MYSFCFMQEDMFVFIFCNKIVCQIRNVYPEHRGYAYPLTFD